MITYTVLEKHQFTAINGIAYEVPYLDPTLLAFYKDEQLNKCTLEESTVQYLKDRFPTRIVTVIYNDAEDEFIMRITLGL